MGGRYSVLSPVGLFPAACLGVDIEAVLAGHSFVFDRLEERLGVARRRAETLLERLANPPAR